MSGHLQFRGYPLDLRLAARSWPMPNGCIEWLGTIDANGIRRNCRPGQLGSHLQYFAGRYGVAVSTISRIMSGRTWKEYPLSDIEGAAK